MTDRMLASVLVDARILGCYFRLCIWSAVHFCDCSICERRQDSRNRWRQLCAPFNACWLDAQQHYLGSSICQNPERYHQVRNAQLVHTSFARQGLQFLA